MNNEDVKENLNDVKYWFKDGLLHREDGPAIEFPDGCKYWIVNGAYHREDGPAIEFSNGERYYYLNGQELTEKEFNRQLAKHQN